MTDFGDEALAQDNRNAYSRWETTVHRYFPPPNRAQSRDMTVHWDSVRERYIRLASGETGFFLESCGIGRNEKETWIRAERLRDQDGAPLAVESVQIQFERERVLLFTDAQRVWRAAQRGRYWLFDVRTERLVKLARDLPDAMISFAKMSPRGDRVAYVRGHDIYCEDPDSNEAWRLTQDGAPCRLNGEFDWGHEEGFGCRDGFRWAPDGKRIAFWQVDLSGVPHCEIPPRAGEARHESRTLCYSRPADPAAHSRIGVVDLNSGVIRWMPDSVDKTHCYLPRMQWLDDDNILVQTLDRTQQHYRLLRWRLSADQLECVCREHDLAWVDVIAYDLATDKWGVDELPVSGDRAAVYRLSDQDGWRRIYRISLADGGSRVVSPAGFDVARLYGIGSERNRLYFSASPEAAGQRYLYSLDLDSQHALRRITPDGSVGVNRYEIDASGRFAVHSFSGSDVPLRRRLIHLPSHHDLELACRPADAETRSMRGRIFVAQLRRWAGESRDVQCILPPAFDPAYRYPLVFLVYGYPMTQQVSDGYPSRWSRLLADFGYIVVLSDPVGTPCLKGRAWRKGIKHRLGVDNCIDQAGICRSVAQWPQVDPARIAVFGWSEGGTMVLNLLAANPGFFRAGVAVAPIANPFLHYGIYQERYRGLLSEHASAYRAGGPQFSSGLPEDNLLVLHGAADDHVHLQHSADYVRRFAGQPGVHELKIYAGRSHTMDEGPEGMAPVATDIVAFLDRYVGGGRGASAVDGDLKAYLCGLTGTGDHRAVAAGQFL